MTTLSPSKLVFGMCIAEVFSMLSFATFPTLLPSFQADWQLSNTEAGWISGIYFLGYVLAVGVLTALTDRIDPRRIYIGSLVLSVLATLGFGFNADGLLSASFWRLLQGFGLAGTYMPGLKAITDVLPVKNHSRAVAFYTSSFSIGASGSIFLSGIFAELIGWRWTFYLCALGPALAIGLAFRLLPSSAGQRDKPVTRLLDFRPVLRNRQALGFSLAYAAHNAELFGLRSWIVAFLVFCQTQQEGGFWTLAWSAAAIAAVFNLFGMPASILGNELAAWQGRVKTLYWLMGLSAMIAILVGVSSSAPMIWVLLIVGIYSALVAADSATITAGMVMSAEPHYRGATMAMHSLIGFIGAFIGPVVFGLVLDFAGGEQQAFAWTLAFSAMAVLVLLGPLALRYWVQETH
jgi:MFS family permease